MYIGENIRRKLNELKYFPCIGNIGAHILFVRANESKIDFPSSLDFLFKYWIQVLN
jgi:hypothetical protein